MAHTGSEPFYFLLCRHRLSVWVARRGTKIENIGTVREQLFCMLYGFLCIKIFPPVGERVRRNVHDTDDFRPFKSHTVSRVWNTTPRPPSCSSQSSMISLPSTGCSTRRA